MTSLRIISAKFAGVKIVYATVHQLGTPYGSLPHVFIKIALLLSVNRLFLATTLSLQSAE
jgi:hypothetical protein